MPSLRHHFRHLLQPLRNCPGPSWTKASPCFQRHTEMGALRSSSRHARVRSLLREIRGEARLFPYHNQINIPSAVLTQPIGAPIYYLPLYRGVRIGQWAQSKNSRKNSVYSQYTMFPFRGNYVYGNTIFPEPFIYAFFCLPQTDMLKRRFRVPNTAL